MTDAIKVDIWSDVACPWCFIGKRKFEAGAAAAGQPVEVEYHSFELQPDAPEDYPGTHEQFLARHMNTSTEQARQMLARVTGIAESVGLHYDYDHLQTTNTVKAHELIHYAKAHGKQLEMKERLLKAYFEEGKHVGHIDELVSLAAEVGLDAEDARQALESNRYVADVRDDQAQAAAYGINGVPFFVFEGKYGVSGAQAPEVFEQVLNQVAAEKETAA